jgi:prepilin-type N-terminal cleavage/methylation domain-containing protein
VVLVCVTAFCKLSCSKTLDPFGWNFYNWSMHKLSFSQSQSKGFTLLEVVVVVAIVSILAVLAVFAAVHLTKTSSREARINGTLTTLSQAFARVKLHAGLVPGVPDDNPGNVLVTGGADPQEDARAALAFYVDHGYISKEVSLEGITFLAGQWMRDPDAP